MKKVLVVDDSEDFREVVSDILDDAGYEVDLAESAEEAMKFCEEKTFDIVLCDLVLPVVEDEAEEEELDNPNDSVMVGIRAIQVLKEKYPDLPVIAVSGEMTGLPLQMTRKFGAVSCLSKPFGRDELLTAIENALVS